MRSSCKYAKGKSIWSTQRCVRFSGGAAECNCSFLKLVPASYPDVPRAFYIDERTLTHELVVNLRMYYTEFLMIISATPRNLFPDTRKVIIF